jgi:hypothetical protein
MILPEIRRNLLVQELNDEVLIYDQTTNKSYCLNSTAKTVFNACNGKDTFEDLKFHLPENVIYLSLDELKRNNLLASSYVSPFVGMSRRNVIKKVGLATMVALPVISSLIAPSSANAASGGLALYAACSSSSQCSTGNCQGGNDGPSICCSPSATNNYTYEYFITVSTAQECRQFDNLCCSGTAVADPNGAGFDCLCPPS